jgi:methionine sulfoxide reductase heme-binding subunit
LILITIHWTMAQKSLTIIQYIYMIFIMMVIYYKLKQQELRYNIFTNLLTK